MYYIEHNAQPNQFSSVPDAIWWAVITLSTVGYGDVYPITLLGKIVGGVIAIIGIAFFSLPTGILASGFNEVLEEQKDNLKKLPISINPIIKDEDKEKTE